MSQVIDPREPLLVTHDTPQLDAILNNIVYLHAHGVLHDGQLATFMPPFTYSKMLKYWIGYLDQERVGRRNVIVQLMPVSTRTAQLWRKKFFEKDEQDVPFAEIILPNPDNGGTEEAYEVAGVVSLWKPETETGPFRCEVQKLFTSPNHRRKGIAKANMRKLEEVALAEDRWWVILDTTVGLEAEDVYPRLGYKEIGVTEEYGISPIDGSLVDGRIFLKNLKKGRPILSS